MKIIRDNELGGLAMIPLLVDWGINRCNVRGCTTDPNTIIGDVDGAPVFGLCEAHYQQGNTPGGTSLDLVFDNSDRKAEVR